MRLNKPHLKKITRLANPQGERLNFVRLDKNERTTGFPKAFLDQILGSLPADFITAYPETEKLRQKIAQWVHLEPQQIAIFAGSDPAIKSAYETFVNPHDEVVYLAPTFAMATVYGNLFQAALKPVGMEADLSANPDRLIQSITATTSLVYLANPNSPSGTELNAQDLERVIAHCHNIGCPILVDEAYYHFTQTTALPLVNRYDNLLVARTYSKACGMAGVRIGFVAGSPSIIELVSKWRPMYEVNSFAVTLGLALLDHTEVMDQYVDEVIQARNQIREWGKKHDVLVYPSSANFVNLKIGKQNIPKIMSECQQKGILVRESGSTPPLDDCLRISLGVSSQVEPVLNIIKQNLFN